MKSKLTYSIIFSLGVGAILALMLSCKSLQEYWLRISFLVFLLLVVTSFLTWFSSEKKWFFGLFHELTILISVGIFSAGAFRYIIVPNYETAANLFRGGWHYFYSLLVIYAPFLFLTSDKISGEKISSFAKEKLGITEVTIGGFDLKLTRKSLPTFYLVSVLVAPLAFQWPEKWMRPGAETYSIHYSYLPEFACFTMVTFTLYVIVNWTTAED